VLVLCRVEPLPGREMSLRELLQSRRDAILERWRGAVFGAFPEQTVRFFRNESNRFENPVGHAIIHDTATILDAVIAGEPHGASQALESLVRIRAVQDVSAAEAVAFAFQLKRALRSELAGELAAGTLWTELIDLDERIDGLASAAFEVYVGCRDQIANMRIGEMRRRVAAVLQRLGEPPTEDPDSPREESRMEAGGKA